MAKVKINGTWLIEENEIRGMVRAFKNLLSTTGDWRLDVSGLSFKRLEAQEVARLKEPFFEEVFDTLKGFNGDEALGLDGFSMAFWQFSWEFVKEEVMRFFKEFHEHNCFFRSLSATFLVLIPRKGGVVDFRDFRPTNLVGGLYKWLAKVPANRLKLVVGKVISKA